MVDPIVLPARFYGPLPDGSDPFFGPFDEINGLGAEVLGVSTDSVHSHRAWIKTPRSQNGIEGLKFPLASDAGGRLSRVYNILIEEANIASAAYTSSIPRACCNIRSLTRQLSDARSMKLCACCKLCKPADFAQPIGSRVRQLCKRKTKGGK